MTQFLVEEACYERLERAETRVHEHLGVDLEDDGSVPGITSPGAVQAAAHAAAMAKLRGE